MAITANLEPGTVLELSSLGAERAAAAYASLLGRPVRPEDPHAVSEASGLSAAHAETAVCFEMEGAVHGVVALLLTDAAREALLDALGADTAAAVRQSALREVGNIVASQAVSAVADRLGSRIALSVPTLVAAEGDRTLLRLISRRRPAAVTAVALSCGGSGEDAVLVFAPDAP
jgi:chemotaxis protein CheY-P-specific phosphatase CheC